MALTGHMTTAVTLTYTAAGVVVAHPPGALTEVGALPVDTLLVLATVVGPQVALVDVWQR